ncbi:hypothetical protein NDU88_006974 [Pleurodeles waltl]|uniref:Ig-like domain-containing protein n=1 Tax=Pleurodeles waltl TaxID=8319 RepID=A0AAV7WG10_PLEWA|nr:hypothetical protein NDU88_006974 [Pleurodeles waltl]
MGTPYGTCTFCALLGLLVPADAAHPEPTKLQVYGHHGSDVLFPGVETELQGEGVLEWHVKKAGNREPQWILTYHYGSDEPQIFQKYQHRIIFSVNNASLRLLSLTPHDEGLYILHLMFVDKNHVLLKVIEPISEVNVMKIQPSSESGVRLMCEASGDVWNLTWWNNGRELMQDITREGNTSELVIKEVGTGSYICVAWNPVSQLQTSYQITQESAVTLYVVGFLIAAVVFSLPVYVSQISHLICQTPCCEPVKQKVDEFGLASFICWILFLICAVVSACLRLIFSGSSACPACKLAFLVALGSSLCMEFLWWLLKTWTKSQSQENWMKEMNQWIVKHMKGALTFLRLALRSLVLVGSLSMVLLHFCTDVHAYRKPSRFGWTVSIAVVVPVMAVLLIHWCCRPNGLFGLHNTDRSPKLPGVQERADDMELGIQPSKVSDHGYRLVPTVDDPTAT